MSPEKKKKEKNALFWGFNQKMFQVGNCVRQGSLSSLIG
jgi:hypothetical protein